MNMTHDNRPKPPLGLSKTYTRESVISNLSTRSARRKLRMTQTVHRRKLQKMEFTESVNVDDADGDKLREHYSKFTKRDRYLQALARYIVCAVIAVAAALGYELLHFVTKYYASWKFSTFLALSGKDVGISWLFNTGLGLAFALVGTIACIYEPAAQGSGMPEVISYLNGVERPRFLTFKTLVFKYIGMICIVNSGLFSGYDGPMIHCATLLGVVIVRNIKKLKRISLMFYGEHIEETSDPSTANVLSIHRERELRTFAVIGSVAGMTSVFQVVLAGVTFALEEAVSYYEPHIILKSLFTSVISLVVITLIKQGRKISTAKLSVYAVNTSCELNFAYQDVAAYMAMGLIAGVAGHFYNLAVGKLRTWRSQHIQPSMYRRVAEVVILVLITSTVVVFIPSVQNCTQFDRSLRHMERLRVKRSGPCENSCVEWTTDRNSNRVLWGECQEFIHNELCIPDEVKTQILNDGFDSYLGINQTDSSCTEDNLISLIPSTSVDLVRTLQETIISNPTKTLLPDGLITATNVSSGHQVISMLQATNFNSSLISARRLTRRADPLKSPGIANVETGCYYQLRSLFFNTPETILKNLFIRGYYFMYEAYSLAIFAGIYIVLSLATHHISLPTDLVIPTLIIGAACGRLFGIAVNEFKFLSGQTLVDPGAYALIGMSAFWAGTSRLPVTIALVSVEMTNDPNYLPGIIIAVFIATIVGNYCGESQYHEEIVEMGLPFLPQEPPHELHLQKVESIMTKNPITVKLKDSRSNLRAILDDEEHSHNGFPVVDEKGKLRGLVLRCQVERVLSPDILTSLSNIAIRRESTASPRFGPTKFAPNVDGPDHVVVPLDDANGPKTNSTDSASPSSSLSSPVPNERNNENGTSTQSDIPFTQSPKSSPPNSIYESNQNDRVQNYRLEIDTQLSPSPLSPSMHLSPPFRTRTYSRSRSPSPMSSTDNLKDEVIDLTNVMNSTPAVCWPDSSASKAYLMMRMLGVRHIVVLDREEGHVCGVITRIDFTSHMSHGKHGKIEHFAEHDSNPGKL